ncbi:putative ESF1 like protein [Blattamonas nauphoetae]|uniref:ESF1 like protein n=1 Tax=Blattamonas nauphoetae TaxID=2049346 RepID=A0ABQ9YEQ8_9EUKA|nr:putative ESF1 like protein [Blattamonas nauphoetae]
MEQKESSDEQSEEQDDSQSSIDGSFAKEMAQWDAVSSSDEDESEIKPKKRKKSGDSQESSDEESESTTSAELDAMLAEEDSDNDASGIWDTVTGVNAPRVDIDGHRLAILNLDWETVHLKDIYLCLKSALPSTGSLKTIKLYLSEFGKKMMQKDISDGPQAVIAALHGVSLDEMMQKDEEIEVNEEQEQESSTDDSASPGTHLKSSRELSEEKQKENEAMREYEASKLRYFYAVADFDSVATANHIYAECNDVEIMDSGNALDLRVVPDEETFDEEPVDVFTETDASRLFGPSDGKKYRPPSAPNAAFAQSGVESTWDRPDREREKLLSTRSLKGALDEEELEQYIASNDEESDADESGSDVEDDDKPQKESTFRMNKNEYMELLGVGKGESESEGGKGDDLLIDFEPLNLEQSDSDSEEGGRKKKEREWKPRSQRRDGVPQVKGFGRDLFFDGSADVKEERQKRKEAQLGEEEIKKRKKMKESRMKEREQEKKEKEERKKRREKLERKKKPKTDRDAPRPDIPFDDDSSEDGAVSRRKLKKAKREKQRDVNKMLHALRKEEEDLERQKETRRLLDLDEKDDETLKKKSSLLQSKKKEVVEQVETILKKERNRAEFEKQAAESISTDPRFSALFSDSSFSVDPTHPAYKPSHNVQKQVGRPKFPKKNSGKQKNTS